jgi:hypothetical protein
MPRMSEHKARRPRTLIPGTTIVALLLIVCAAGAAQKQPAENAHAKPDPGSVSGNVYTNVLFGMRYEFPDGWHVDEVATNQANADARKSMDRQRAGGGAVQENYQLLEVSKSLPAGAQVGNPRIVISASSVTATSQSGRDVFNQLKQIVISMPTIQIVHDPEDVTFGGRAFTRMDQRFILDTVPQGFEGDAITVLKGYLVNFQIFAYTQSELDELFKSLNSLQFNP